MFYVFQTDQLQTPSVESWFFRIYPEKPKPETRPAVTKYRKALKARHGKERSDWLEVLQRLGVNNIAWDEKKLENASCATGKLLQSDVPGWRFFGSMRIKWVPSQSVLDGKKTWVQSFAYSKCTFQLDPKIPIGGGVSLGWFFLLPLPKSQSKKPGVIFFKGDPTNDPPGCKWM